MMGDYQKRLGARGISEGQKIRQGSGCLAFEMAEGEAEGGESLL